MIQVFCDGSITGGAWGKKDAKASLPHAWSGWWAKDEHGKVLQWRSLDLGEAEYMSANVAEYFAVRSALTWLYGSIWKHHQIEVLSDSQVVIYQLTGKQNCYHPKLMVLRDTCRRVAGHMNVRFVWTRRENNREADVLSKALQIWGRQAQNWEEVLAYLRKKPSGRVKKSGPRSAVPEPKSGG
jgi:ribonuclease HI